MEVREIELAGKVYRVDEFGNVYNRISKDKTKTRAVHPGRGGYLQLVCKNDGVKSHNYYIHQIVYRAFHGEIPEGYTVDHIDGNFLNNHYSNLQVLTMKDNVIKAQAENWKFLSPQQEVVEIYNLAEFCRNNGLHRGHMAQVNSGKRKQHKGWRKTYEQ